MEQYLTDLCKSVEKQLRQIESRNSDVLSQAKEAITFQEEAFAVLKAKVVNSSFECDEQEISFFKQVKPRLFSNLVYYRKVLNVELNKPAGGNDTLTGYLKHELERINDFFIRNHAFILYCRAGERHLDHFYFKRGKPAIHLNIDISHLELDPHFSTAGDLLLTRTMANDRLQAYLTYQHDLLSGNLITDLPKERITWTANKSDLIELAYGFWAEECFDNGNISLTQLVTYLETIFNVDLGNVPRSFLDMKIRNNPTPFMDKLKQKLLEKMGRK